MADTPPPPQLHLEALRVSDSSWHPCQVSLSSSGSLKVHFEGLDLEDVILNVEDLYARLRVRSLPLEGDDCQRIKEGEHILAASKSNFKSLFFDAVVQEVRLIRHSKRIICRCTFMVKWMHQDPDSENTTVSSSLVMKLSRESVKTHPVVAAFLNSMKKTSVSDGAFTIVDEPYGEYDMNGIIGKQIEEIGTLADGATTELLEDIIVRVKPDSSKGNIKEVADYSKLTLITNGGNHLRRSNRNRNKMDVEAEACEPVITSTLQESAGNIFANEELAEYRSPLNPLAARAALASLVSKIPQKLDFSFYEEEREVALESNDAARIINSAVQNDGGSLNGDAEPGDLDIDMIGEDLKSRKQVTLPAEKGEEIFIRKVVLALRNDDLPQCAKPKSSHNDHLLSHALGSKKKGAFINDELVDPGYLGKDMIREEIKSEKQLTLSAEKGEETSIRKVVLALRNDKLKQCAEANSSHKINLLPRTTGSQKKEAFINDELFEKNKKLKVSSDQTHKRNEDEGSRNENSTMDQKRSRSLKQQPSRSSPRLSCTRSGARS